MSTKYEVQEFNLFGGWSNNWSSEDGTPSTFASKKDAEAELDWFLSECQEAVEDGNMEDAPDRDSFRIVEVVA